MPRSSVQAPSAIVMVRPHHFRVNTQTAADNSFQKNIEAGGAEVSQAAYAEHCAAADLLESKGVRVHVFEDTGTETPDSVFPNNWFSTHAGGHVAIYPMKAPNRRLERRWEIIEMLKASYRVQDVIDYSGLEPDGLFLEGTGAMVLDHISRVAYAAQSDRTNPIVLERFCTHFNYEPMVFPATDPNGNAIYHTNVMMCIGTNYALVGLDLITDAERRDQVVRRLTEAGREVISLSAAQIAAFAGNAIELNGRDGAILALSNSALDILDTSQKSRLARSVELVPIPFSTIEMAGGSVRCAIAGVHLATR